MLISGVFLKLSDLAAERSAESTWSKWCGENPMWLKWSVALFTFTCQAVLASHVNSVWKPVVTLMKYPCVIRLEAAVLQPMGCVRNLVNTFNISAFSKRTMAKLCLFLGSYLRNYWTDFVAICYWVFIRNSSFIHQWLYRPLLGSSISQSFLHRR
jgi:hypothetical protein